MTTVILATATRLLLPLLLLFSLFLLLRGHNEPAATRMPSRIGIALEVQIESVRANRAVFKPRKGEVP